MIPDGFEAVRERWLGICDGQFPQWEEDFADLRRLLLALDDFDAFVDAFQESFPKQPETCFHCVGCQDDPATCQCLPHYLARAEQYRRVLTQTIEARKGGDAVCWCNGTGLLDINDGRAIDCPQCAAPSSDESAVGNADASHPSSPSGISREDEG